MKKVRFERSLLLLLQSTFFEVSFKMVNLILCNTIIQSFLEHFRVACRSRSIVISTCLQHMFRKSPWTTILLLLNDVDRTFSFVQNF